tara:strand:+ start:14847 stop:15251 length:405 start_codon:yes stop_codon:yes gene_type:complete
MNIGIVSGYFDPLEKRHISLFEDAACRVDYLICILNNDHQADARRVNRHRGAFEIGDFSDRFAVLNSIGCIDLVVPAKDSVTDAVGITLSLINDMFGYGNQLYFFNGGTIRTVTPAEQQTCENNGIKLVFNIGN